MYDRHGWFHTLQQQVNCPYPEELRQAIVAKNHPILRHTISSYLHQIELAIARSDLVSVNHRISALLASYFDILFAVNRRPHPGEKRLVKLVQQHCRKYPAAMEQDINYLLHAIATPSHIPSAIHTLLQGLDDLLIAEGLID